MAVNYKLKGIRVAFNKTQGDISLALGISTSAYNLKERGTRQFTRNEIAILADIFKLTPQEAWDIFFAAKVNANETITA